jgi:hypothetical protein
MYERRNSTRIPESYAEYLMLSDAEKMALLPVPPEIDVDDDTATRTMAANGLRHTEWRRAGDRQRGGRGVEPW